MRANGFITVVIPFEVDPAPVDALLTAATPALGGNQVGGVQLAALTECELIHFLSIAVLDPDAPMDPEPPASRGGLSHLLIEISSDTGATETLAIVAEAIESILVQVFDQAALPWKAQSNQWIGTPTPEPDSVMLARFMIAHRVEIGDQWGMALGQVHDGSPGMTVRRILAEQNLAELVAERIDAQRTSDKAAWLDRSPMLQLEALRNWLWEADGPGPTKWAFSDEAAPLLGAAPIGKYRRHEAAVSIIHKLLWPLGILLTLLLLEQYFLGRIGTTWSAGYSVWVASGLVLALVLTLWVLRPPRQYPFRALVATTLVVIALFHSFGAALQWLVVTATAIAAVAALAVLYGRWLIQQMEQKDPVDDHAPDSAKVSALMREENYVAQNHMFTISTIKPELLRTLALRVILTIVGANRFVSRPGFLGKNGVIHSARWLWLRDPKLSWFRLRDPGRLIFWSNFDGTWESYVGDFVADAPDNVTGLWSNCVGFPRAKNLTDEGAKNRDRLVRWARRQQKPTHFWYSAYPDLTTARIRINAAIRQGIASAQTDADARDWLSLFGSQPRLPGTLMTSQIPTLVFGALPKLPYATCFMIQLSSNARARHVWLKRVSKDVTFGETLPGQVRAVALAFSVSALRKLGVPESAISTFPVPFKEGMWTDERARALGDQGTSKPSKWRWGSAADAGGGRKDTTVDVFLVIYGAASTDVEAGRRRFFVPPSGRDQRIVASVTLNRPANRNAGQEPSLFHTEHFGFADGVSQPAIIGLRRSQRRTARNDRVGPGEIVLGYPDNLGRLPPSPLIDASEDPDHLLADDGSDPFRQRPDFSRYEGTGQRDLGANGSFLVVRQLRQHVYRWDALLESTSDKVFKEFVASAASDGTGAAAIEWGDPKEVDRRPAARVQPTSNLSVAGAGGRSRQMYTRELKPEDLEHAIAAKLLGRWRDGSPLVRCPMVPGTEEAALDNAFRFGVEDPQGLACPLGAHIRRANPRDTRYPGSQEEIDSVNRHRLLRVGRAYGGWPGDGGWRKARKSGEAEPNVGLMFMCLNADIERQYEFVQKTWILNRNMNGLEGEGDPLTGQGGMFSIPTPRGVIRLGPFKQLVTVLGGGYFFMPGAATLKFLSRIRGTPQINAPRRRARAAAQGLPDGSPGAPAAAVTKSPEIVQPETVCEAGVK